MKMKVMGLNLRYLLKSSLLYKAQNSPFDNSYSNKISLFQLETKNSF